MSIKPFIENYFKAFGHFILNKNYRSYSKILWKSCFIDRYKPFSVKLSGRPWNAPDSQSFLAAYYEIFFKEIYSFNSGAKDPLIIDCGANVGLSAVFFSQLFPNSKIIAFEPDPKIFDYLIQNIKENNAPNIESRMEAVWTCNEKLSFQQEGADAGSIQISGNSLTEVQGIDFRDFLKQFSKIDMLKIDIEGAEHKLLPHINDQLEKVDHLFLEYHSFENQAQDLSKIVLLLENAGFRYFLEPAQNRKLPFINRKGYMNMDNQINIFCYRNN